MSAPAYATAGDLDTHMTTMLGRTSTAAEQRALPIAHRLVRRATLTDVYDADAVTGLPTDTAVRAAMTEASVTQVTAMSQQGTLTAADTGGWSETSVGSARLKRSAAAESRVEADRATVDQLGVEARHVLHHAGLAAEAPRTW